MTVTPAQLDAHLKAMKGRHNYWDGIPGHQCMVIFASVNKLLGGPAYAAAGAKDLWNNPALSAGYVQLPAGTVSRFGDIGVYGASWGDGWGHVVVSIRDYGNEWDAFGQNPAVAGTTRLSKAGLLGILRPRNLSAPPAPAKPAPKPATPALATRTVTATKAYPRTAPRAGAPLAPGYPAGINKGVALAVKGYVVGENPYGATPPDNAWYVTKSGFYVWANTAGNSLAGLVRL